MFGHVLGGVHNHNRIILKLSKPLITPAAKQPSNFSTDVIVIDMSQIIFLCGLHDTKIV